ncbi:unnamed protein product [Adineta steineri]|uniref:Uncharacterized protein n=1 Tax=Adineta steineri TaxID=433720 RepID=A0A813N061_9BILA|nr:unnamed protein product [Adineta steineri]CAF3647690.1 unnamed protein product [Adineta steineri]
MCEDKTAIITVLMIGLGIIFAPSSYRFFSNKTPPQPPSSCNMTIAKNRNFHNYYGIIGMTNHFTADPAQECQASIIYQPTLPQMILKPDHSASSFMTLAELGTGKTLLRCEYLRSLSSNDYLKLTILDKQVTQYLDRFVHEMDGETKNYLVDWSENEFAQLLLSTLVTNFIDSYDTHKHNGTDLSLAEKINLITIICYYYNGLGTSQLEKFVNWFLNKGLWSQYKADGEHVQQSKHHNQQLLNHLIGDLNKFSILNKNSERLGLLLIILEGEGFQNRAIAKHLYGEHFKDLVEFSSFIKTYFKKTPVFVIDGIDQNVHFVGNENRDSFESFCRSSVSPSILSMVMANHFYLSLFYPKIHGVNIKDFIARKDKFPIHTISWSTKSLINYADYVLQEMNKNANDTRCKAFPDFKILVNYADKRNAEVINKIPTPRALHRFIAELIPEMNNDANNVVEPFEATFENVDTAYKNSFESFETKTNG